jgi:dCMP deaminase
MPTGDHMCRKCGYYTSICMCDRIGARPNVTIDEHPFWKYRLTNPNLLDEANCSGQDSCECDTHKELRLQQQKNESLETELRDPCQSLYSQWFHTLSRKTRDYVYSILRFHKDKEVPKWHDYFLQMAFLVSSRSKDAETQHGCVITDASHRVVGVGYNSYPKGMPDWMLPNLRPAKYDWMVHSERNALSNCLVRPEGGTAYITGQPCNDCAMAMYQEGIKNFVLAERHGSKLLNEKTDAIFEILTNASDIKVTWIRPDKNALQHALTEIEKLD